MPQRWVLDTPLGKDLHEVRPGVGKERDWVDSGKKLEEARADGRAKYLKLSILKSAMELK